MKKRITILLILAMVMQICCAGIAFADEPAVTEETTDASETAKVEDNTIPVIKSGLDPIWTISDISVPDKIVIGQNFEFVVTVRNMGTGAGRYPYFMFTEGADRTDLTHFTVISGDGNGGYDPHLSYINGGETRMFRIVMKVNNDVKELPEGQDYQLNFTIGSDNSKINSSVESASAWDQKMYRATASVHVKPVYGLSDPVFVVESVTFDPEITDGVKETTANITLQNISDVKANNVVVSLAGHDVGQTSKKNIIIKDLTSSKRLYDVRGKQKVVVSYQVELNPDRQDNEMELTVQYDGQKEPQVELLNMPIPLTQSSTGKVPKVIIERYTLEPEPVLAGEYVTMQLYVQNTNALPVKNVSIKMDVPTETTSAGGTASSGTVFSPVASSNTFFIDSIPGKSTAVKKITMYVNPNAIAKTYIVPIEISYENNVGEECPRITDNINIPVTQESKLDIIKTSVPQFGNVGEPLDISAEFVNVGKTSLSNMKVTLDAPVYNPDEYTYYIGNFETNATDEFSAMIFPENEGTFEGNIVFSYIDGDNREASLAVPFSVEIGPAPEMPEFVDPGMYEEPKEPFVDKVKRNAVTILLAAAVIGEGIALFRVKRKQKAEEELMQ